MLDLSAFGVLKAAEYMRYSTDNQTENSIAYQQAGIRKYARAATISTMPMMDSTREKVFILIFIAYTSTFAVTFFTSHWEPPMTSRESTKIATEIVEP